MGMYEFKMKTKVIIFFYVIISMSIFAKGYKYNNAQMLEAEQKRIEDKMYRLAQGAKKYPEQDVYPITDGVANCSEFLQKNYRVMFILKEGYDDFDEQGNPIGGGFMITAGNLGGNYSYISLTWRRILQIAYGIFNKEKKFEKIPKVPSYIMKNDEYANIVRSIIYINSNKMPAKKTSNDNDVQQCLYYWKDIIREQINLYDPEIIIFCGTFKFYKNNFNEFFNIQIPVDREIKKYSDSKIVKGAFIDSKKRLFIDVVHPGNGYISGGDKKYFEDIIKVLEDYKMLK